MLVQAPCSKLPVLSQTNFCLLSTMLLLFCWYNFILTKSSEKYVLDISKCFQKLKAKTSFCHLNYYRNTFQVWQRKPFVASQTRNLWSGGGQDGSICELHRVSYWSAQLKVDWNATSNTWRWATHRLWEWTGFYSQGYIKYRASPSWAGWYSALDTC